MDMTTKERIKLLRGIDDTGADDQIDQVIGGVSARFEAILGRHALDTSYEETYELHRAAKVLWLRAYPISAISAVTYSSVPNDTSATALIADDEYYLDAEAGIVRLRLSTTPYDPGYIAVEYDGGMGTTTAAFITNYPEIAAACDQQVVYELNRRNTPGGQLSTRDGRTEFSKSEVNLLRGVREVLVTYSRTVL